MTVYIKPDLPLAFESFIFKRKTTVINSNRFLNRSKVIQNTQRLSPQVTYAQVSQEQKRQIRALNIAQVLIARLRVVQAEFLQVFRKIEIVHFFARLGPKRYGLGYCLDRLAKRVY